MSGIAEKKNSMIAVDPVLHGYLKLIAALDGKGLKETIEAPIRRLLEARRAELEKMTGKDVEL